MTREEFIQKWANKAWLIGSTIMEEMRKDLNSLFLPPAELDHQLDHQLDHPADATAEEILQKYMDASMIICPLHVVPRTVALSAMREFAAQRQPQPTEEKRCNICGKPALERGLCYEHEVCNVPKQPTAEEDDKIVLAEPDKLKWRGCGKGHSYCGKIEQPTAEGAESIIACPECMAYNKITNKEMYKCWNCEAEFRYQIQPQPTAEGAEEIRQEVADFIQSKRIWIHSYISDRNNIVSYEVAELIAEFAALTADKRLREELVKFIMWVRLQGGIAGGGVEANLTVDEYLKIRSHE